MISNVLRENKMVSYILTVLRVYLGWSWMNAGFHKLTSDFDATGFLTKAATNPVKGPDGVVYEWWVQFLNDFALPHVEIFNILIPWGEFLVGLGLILGCFTTLAMFFGLIMNFSFLLSGTISHNPTDILIGFILLAAGYNASKYTGLDHWVIPYLMKKWFHKEIKEERTEEKTKKCHKKANNSF